jgi:hypothetical protein
MNHRVKHAPRRMLNSVVHFLWFISPCFPFRKPAIDKLRCVFTLIVLIFTLHSWRGAGCAKTHCHPLKGQIEAQPQSCWNELPGLAALQEKQFVSHSRSQRKMLSPRTSFMPCANSPKLQTFDTFRITFPSGH